MQTFTLDGDILTWTHHQSGEVRQRRTKVPEAFSGPDPESLLFYAVSTFDPRTVDHPQDDEYGWTIVTPGDPNWRRNLRNRPL